MALLNFDATNVPPSAPPEVIPAGWYNAQMTGSEMKPTQDGTGQFLSCEFTIIDGDYAGRKQFDRMNLVNKNPKAVEIAFQTLSAICHAVGVIQVADSQQLHGRPLQLKVSLRAAGLGADGKMYDASNEVKGYKAADGAPAQGHGAAPAWAAAPQQPQQAAKPPVYQPQPAAAPQWAPPPVNAAPAPALAPPQPPAAPAAPAAAPPWAAQPPAGGAAPVPPWARPAA
jgi:hypothetical protein